ncbi:hypothetical protein RIF29_13693 [Crotalaria pallida]|uniref:Uncharacterized protein n=1 Tax=Crotalaria pallida TaxID=3830 RepID=A0AAN9IPM8_CROPI
MMLPRVPGRLYSLIFILFNHQSHLPCCHVSRSTVPVSIPKRNLSVVVITLTVTFDSKPYLSISSSHLINK